MVGRCSLQGTRDHKPCFSPLHDTQHKTRLEVAQAQMQGLRVQHVGTAGRDPDNDPASGEVVGTMVPELWLMYGRDRDLMVVGNTDVWGGQSSIEGSV